MTDTLVYNIPAWSKEIDPLFACDKAMLFPDQTATELYAARRMSDSALSADTGTSATTTDPDSPATEPDSAAPAHSDARKPSLPGIGALTPLLDPADFPRRASLPTLTSEISLSRSPGPTLSRANFRPRAYEQQLSGYSFPPASDQQYFSAGTSSTGTSFPSPFTSPLSPDYQTRSASLPRDEAFNPFGQGRWPADQQWSPTTPEVPPTPASASNSPRPKRRASASPPLSAAPQSPAQPPAQEGQPPRRRGKLPKHTTDLLKEWLHAHSDHPYPSEDEKRDLCARTKLSMSQVSNWMINARRRILAPAKHPTQAATTTEPYRPLSASLPRPIGSLYPTHHAQHLYPHHPQSIVRRVSSEADSLRLYEPPYHHQPQYAHPQYAPQGMYDPHRPERRLAYPASTVGYAGEYAGAPQQQQQQQQQGAYTTPPQLFLPSPQRDAAPRYFAAAGEQGAL